MPGLFKRTVLVVVGVALGIAIAAGIGLLQRRAADGAARPAPPAMRGEPAPATRT
ncbi:MAG: hypothetical protein ABW032_10560 [Burkholderiaceae bacterium]